MTRTHRKTSQSRTRATGVHAPRSPRSPRSPGPPSAGKTARPSRLLTILRTPGHARSLLVRRCIGIALIITAGIVALSGIRENPEVVVFARDVDAGTELHAEDLTTMRIPDDALPKAMTFSSIEDGVGRVITAPASTGEVLTELRLLGEELTSALVPNGHMVPLKLAEPDLLTLLHHGDTVNIVSSRDGESTGDISEPVVVAENARVIATSVQHSSQTQSPATILIALPSEQAQVVASASLSQPLTVVITGNRAHITTDN